jgi:hypothetical protein
MVGHQAVGPDLDRSFAAALGKQIAVEGVIGRFEEDRLAAIAALGHVMRKSRGNDAAEACHSGIVRHSGPSVQ